MRADLELFLPQLHFLCLHARLLLKPGKLLVQSRLQVQYDEISMGWNFLLKAPML
jgi:hypothetical protein